MYNRALGLVLLFLFAEQSSAQMSSRLDLEFGFTAISPVMTMQRVALDIPVSSSLCVEAGFGHTSRVTYSENMPDVEGAPWHEYDSQATWDFVAACLLPPADSGTSTFAKLGFAYSFEDSRHQGGHYNQGAAPSLRSEFASGFGTIGVNFPQSDIYSLALYLSLYTTYTFVLGCSATIKL
jgi:hypothetical protein